MSQEGFDRGSRRHCFTVCILFLSWPVFQYSLATASLTGRIEEPPKLLLVKVFLPLLVEFLKKVLLDLTAEQVRLCCNKDHLTLLWLRCEDWSVKRVQSFRTFALLIVAEILKDFNYLKYLRIGLKVNDDVFILLYRCELWLIVCRLLRKHEPAV